MKTVTLALEWRVDSWLDDALYIGPFHVGTVRCDPTRRDPSSFWIASGESPMSDHPTREAAMEALEAAVLAMGVKE